MIENIISELMYQMRNYSFVSEVMILDSQGRVLTNIIGSHQKIITS